MEQELIKIGNIKIAEFMGWQTRKQYNEYKGENETVYFKPSDNVPWRYLMPFHSDWNWLIPVLEKIGKISIPANIVGEPWPTTVSWAVNSFGGQICIGDNSLFITSEGCGTHTDHIKLGFGNGTPLELAWQMVIHFIDFYNNHVTNKK